TAASGRGVPRVRLLIRARFDARRTRGAGAAGAPSLLACVGPGCFAHAVASEGSPDIFLAFAAGLLSVLSPCVLPLLPAYLSLVSGLSLDELREGESDAALRRRVLRACLGFIAGFTFVFVVLGIGAVAVGHVVRTWRLVLFGFSIGISQIAGLFILLL